MIRRPTDSERWILIPQMEHARISGVLAEVWGAEPWAPLSPQGELLPAIYHHDDGWEEWDRAPGIDPGRGVPLAFTEMPAREAAAIWQRSIDRARPFGQLATYAIRGHFSALMRRHAGAQNVSPDDQRLARAFLSEHEAGMTADLNAWQQAHPREPGEAIARRAVAQLQFYDALSLWLCTRQQTSPEVMHPPGGPPVTLNPIATGRVAVDPWPFTGPAGPAAGLAVEIAGRAVPAIRYESREHLAATPAEPAQIRIDFTPGDA